MNIIHIVEATGGGVLSMLRLLINGQSSQGHQVSIIYSRRPDTPENIQSLFADEVSLIQVDMYTKLGKLRAPHRIATIVKRLNGDAVFLHSSFAGFLGRLALIFSPNLKIFYIPHGISLLRQDVNKITIFGFYTLEKIASWRKSTVVACSRSEKDKIVSTLGEKKCIVIENAVSDDYLTFSRETAPFNDSKIIINVARLTAAKRPDLFAEIAVATNRTDPETKFVWIGDGDPSYKAHLLRSGVTVTGWLEQDQIKEWLTKASIFLSTSRWEGMPVALIEAQLAGVPVIASRCAGNIDVIEEGVTGWLYQCSNDAVKILLQTLSKSPQVESVTKQARQKAKNRFSSQRYLFEMNQLLDEK